MSECYFKVQYRGSEHEDWKDDNLKNASLEIAAARVEKARAAKIFRGASWRIVRRTDESVPRETWPVA